MMPLNIDGQVKRLPRPAEGEEIPISVISIEDRELMLWIAREPVPLECFPPCIKNIISRPCPGAGKHRASAVLASFLGQAGWDEAEARALWMKASQEMGISEKPEIFSCWFGKMHCPRCETIMRESKGYPRLGLAGLGYCEPEKACREFTGPTTFAADVRTDMDRLEKGTFKIIRTVNLVRAMNWNTGREGWIEISDEEKADLEALLAAKGDQALVYSTQKAGRKMRPKFMLKQSEEPRRAVLSELL
jgi:hypothetical protein